MADTLEDLAARCESAMGYSLDLDHEIGRALGPNGNYSYRPYTASLDAAMTLVNDQLVAVVLAEALARLDQCFNPLDNYLTKLRLYVCAASLRAIAKERG